MKKITFIDTGVLIAAARGEENASKRAFMYLDEREREFASSIFLKLEVLPKAKYNNSYKEVEFYEYYFDKVKYWCDCDEGVISKAFNEAEMNGLSAMDALHVAAAESLHAEEFITSEKPKSSIHRTKTIKIISIAQ